MNRPLFLLPVLLLAGASGCFREVYTPPVSPRADADTDHAYLYGYFEVDAHDPNTWEDTGQTMGLVIACDDGQRYVIRFSMSNPLQVVEIAPSRCSFSGMRFTDRNGDVVGEDGGTGGLWMSHDFAAGNAYYLGDFHGSVRASHDKAVEELADRFEATTTKMQVAFPNLADVPVEKQMFQPLDPHVPARAGGGAPDHPSPQTGEPLLSTHWVPAQTGFQMALSSGYAFPLGSADRSTSQSDFVSGQVPVLLQLGVKAWERLYFGLYGGVGFGGAGGALAGTCAISGVSCSSLTVRGGVEGLVYIFPAARFDPYIGYGLGFEYTDIRASARGTTVNVSAIGLELARITVGVDYRANRIVGFGPYLNMTIGEYEGISAHGPDGSQGGEIGDKAYHAWFSLGARVTLRP